MCVLCGRYLNSCICNIYCCIEMYIIQIWYFCNQSTLSSPADVLLSQHYFWTMRYTHIGEKWSEPKLTEHFFKQPEIFQLLETEPELETLEWWISRLMLDPLFFLISRLA